jgi:cytochrome c oxidase cbb3-type subunit 2
MSRKTCSKPVAVLVFFAFAVPFLMAGAGDGAWMARVPEKDRIRQNPFAGDAQAAAAGAKLFRQNCSKCHGAEGAGQEKKPALRSDRIRQATPGELEWLLNNGSMKNGMPSWSRLPQPQRWQLVTYIKDLAKGQ